MGKEYICKLYPFQTGAEIEELREEIIRCCDCKHFAGAVFGRAGYWCSLLEFGVKHDGFCAWAERDA